MTETVRPSRHDQSVRTVTCRYLRRNGNQCPNPALDDTADVLLCAKHLSRAMPALEAVRLAVFGEEGTAQIAQQAEQRAIRAQVEQAAGLVYYVRAWGYIKIGTTTDISARLIDLKATEILATEPGSHQLESARHRQFATHRHLGEYFHPVPEILTFTEELRGIHGPPITSTDEQMAVAARRLGCVPGQASDPARLGAARLADALRPSRPPLRAH